MANGDAHFWTHQFADTGGTPYAGVKVYRYASGTSTLKNAWIDAGRTTVDENPSIGDSFGRVSFYGDGDYRLHVVTNDGVSLYDWDPVRITADTATMWENNLGTAYPAASTANQGQLFAKVDAFSQLVALGINDTGARFQDIGANLAASTYANLPLSTVDTAGALRRLTDHERGIWMDSGAQWFSIAHQVVDVREFGATGDGATDDTSAFQSALDLVDSLGGGVVYVPPGTYILTSVRMGSNTWLRGSGYASFLKSTTTSAQDAIVINKTSPQYTGTSLSNILADGDSHLRVSDFRMEAVPVDAGGGNFHAYVSFMKANYCLIEGITGTHHAVGNAGGLGYGDKGIQLRGCNFSVIRNCFLTDVPDNAYALNWGESQNDASDGFYGHNLIVGCTYRQTASWSHSAIIPGSHRTLVAHNSVIFPVSAAATHNAIEAGDECTGLVISNNHVRNAGVGIAGSTGNGMTGLILEGNMIEGTDTSSNISVSANFGDITDVVVANNRLTGGALKVSTAGANNCTHVLVIGNTCSGAATPETYGYGIFVQAGSFGQLKYVTVQSNRVHDRPMAGIKVQSGSYVDVVGNVCYNNGWSSLNVPYGSNGNSAGINIDGSLGARVVNNVTDTSAGYGIWVANTTDMTEGVDVIDNRSRGDVSGALMTQDIIGSPIPVARFLRMRGAGVPSASPNYYRCQAGSVFYRNDPTSATTIMYLKQTGIDFTGWVAVTAS